MIFGITNFLLLFIEEGKSFGEVALMSEDSVRNATVIADEETDLLVISRELFNRSMKVRASVFCLLPVEKYTHEVKSVSP